ncbi:hypothetical protein [Synechococcus sp. A15-28]|uniref:hypothetical protein n=1 Tax=Synechococcus sp. A15-28 TaxID=1050638 RepID=UPI001645E9C7|nr:hypothetical protein [Synechococcus sp. A15-28]
MVMRNRCLIALSLLSLVLASSAAWAQQPIKAHLVLTTGVFGSKFSGSNAANSDSTWMVTIPMLSESGCKAEGERWLRRRSRFRKGFREYFCVILR